VKEKYEKAKKYLSSQIKNEKVEKELLEKTDQIVVEHATKKVVKEKANKVVIEKVQGSVTVEEVDKVTKTQNQDGSFEISKQITDNIGVKTTENIHSLVRIKDERVKKLDAKTWNTFITLAYCNKVLGKHESKWIVQNEKARKWIHEQVKDEKLEKEILESCEKVVVEKVSETKKEQPSLFGWVGQIFDDKDTKVQVKPDTKGKGKEVLPEEKKPETGFLSSIKSSVIELGKNVEDALSLDKDDDDDHHEKADALESVKSTTTKDVVKTVVSKQKVDGSIEVSETICNQLGAPSEENVVKTVQQYVTTENLKDAKPSWITTSVNIAYLKNLADKHEGEWKEKYDKARQYLSKEINNPQVEEELINASDKYVVDQSTKKVIKDKKKAAVLSIRSKTSEETVNTALSTQKDDGSFEIHETITKELDNVSPNDLIKKAQSYVKSDKIKPEKSESIFKTAITLGFLTTAMDNPTKELSDKYQKARAYLSSQIDDEKLVEEIIKSSSKVVIDKSSEKVQKESKNAALEEVKKSTTLEATQAIVSTQKDDGSFEVNEKIADNLSTSSGSLVTSVTTYTKNENLKKLSPSIWSTALSMQYLKNTTSQDKGDWAEKYNKAREYLRIQINDESLEKELLETSDKYVLDSVTRKLVKQKEEETLRVRKLVFDEETKKASYSYLIETFNVDDVRSLCSSQGKDGSITFHKLITERLKIKDTDDSITSIKNFVSNQRLRACKDSVFETALTIYILRYVLIEYKNEWSTVGERADKWLKEQLGGDKKLEAELLSACEQYLIEETITHLKSVVVLQDVETVQKITLEVSDETRQTVFKYLQSRAIIDDAHVLTKSQHSDGSFVLHQSILEHLQIPSIDESIKCLVRYVGQKSLKECDKTIWQTAFVITYLRIVLVEYEKEWSPACERAKKCVSKKLGNSKLEEELYKACDQYLIEKAVELYNSPSLEVSVIRLEVDEETRTTVYNGLRSHAKVEDARALCKSQTKNHSFILHKIISDQLEIKSTDDAVDSLKSYVGSLRLRRLDNSIWISAFVVTYFKLVLVEHESEWSAVCDRTKSWISQQVHNAELETELYSACEQYLIKQGCQFLNNQTTITSEVTKRTSHSVAIGSDGGVLTSKNAYLNSELIVVGAAARAKCKVKLESAHNKTLEDVSKATDLAVKYAEDEVNRLFGVNVTHSNKDDVLLRARRATKFLMDEYYKPGEDCC
ncbi:3434_t:CDS:2, partial [Funneliformis geosporum]